MEKQMNAEEVVEAIQKMEPEERWKLLKALYDLYYNKDGKSGSLDLDY